MDKLKLSKHQYAVGQAEYATGHVLKNDRSLFLKDDNIKEVYEIFNSYEQAKEFGIKKVNDHPDIECYVYDCDGKLIFAYDTNGERKLS